MVVKKLGVGGGILIGDLTAFSKLFARNPHGDNLGGSANNFYTRSEAGANLLDTRGINAGRRLSDDYSLGRYY